MNGTIDEQELRGLIGELVEGWNAGDGTSYARPFAEDADFVNIMGLKARGREQIAFGHDEILSTYYKGTKLACEVEAIRFLRPDVALADLSLRLEGSDGMPFTLRASSAGVVFSKDGGRWSIAAFRNMIPFERPGAGPVEQKLAAPTQAEPVAEQEIETLLAAMFAAWNRGDVPAYTAFWSPDADLVNVLGMHRRGRGQILAELEFLHSGRFRGTQIHELGHTIRFLTPEIAVVQVRWEMHGDPGQTGHPVENGTRRGIFTHTMRRAPEGWRLAASQNTDVVPVPDFLEAANPRAAA